MKILVTGSEGYIGSALCPSLEQSGHEVRHFDIAPDSPYRGDVRNYLSVHRAAEGCDCIVHLAAIVGEVACDAGPKLAREVNVEGTSHVVTTNKRVIMGSPLGRFHVEQGHTMTEETPLAPISTYEKTKAEAEKGVLGVVFEQKNVVLRFGSLYGLSPAMCDELLVHFMLKQALYLGTIKVVQGWAIQPIVRLADAINAIKLFVENPQYGGLYHAATESLSRLVLASRIQEATDCQIELIKDAIGGISYIANTDKLQHLSWRPSYSMIPDLYQLINYYQKEAGEWQCK
jgi:nucleoside-diphosphate-sugar epimerase